MRVTVIVGGGVSLVLAITLVWMLTDAHDYHGLKLTGISWIAKTGTVQGLNPVLALIFFAAFCSPFGYLIGDRIERGSDLIWAGGGLLLGMLAGWLFGLDIGERHGRAAVGNRAALVAIGAHVGALLGVTLLRRIERARPSRPYD